jgi:transcriptional regulator with XRE-family HTH domain
MKERVSQILKDFKANKIAAQNIEKELGISNGLLGKAAKGKTNLSDEKMKLLEKYYAKLKPINVKVETVIEKLPAPVQEVPKKVAEKIQVENHFIKTKAVGQTIAKVGSFNFIKKPFMNDAIRKKLGL